MRLMAHFPLLAHPDPRSALLICFGVGNTASAIAAHEGIERIDVVDLNREVIETAPEFGDTSRDVHLDPRIRFINDDGRNFLRVSDASYDLVTSEPPPPMHAGVYRLYSREYYESVLEHLSEAGMMTQWLPIHQMPPEAVDLATRTFVDVFPYTLIFTGFESDFILLGSRTPIDLRRLEERFGASEGARADLGRLKLEKPLSLVARVVRGDRSLRREWGEGRTISDQHNDLEHLFPARLSARAIAYDPQEVLEEVQAERLAMAPDLRAVVMHLGRLRYHAEGFPAGSLATVRSTNEDVALADLDWFEISRLSVAAGKAGRAGRPTVAIGLLQQALDLSDEQPQLLLVQASFMGNAGRHGEAVRLLQRFREIEPEEAVGHYGLGVALLRSGRSQEALASFEEALRLRPDWPSPLGWVAWLLATDPDAERREPERAVALAERGVARMETPDPWLLDALAASYAAAGRFDDAVPAAQRAARVASKGGAEGLAEQIRGRLALYRRDTAYRRPGGGPAVPAES
jgi:tetratricopeptide (TPR) repeat protein